MKKIILLVLIIFGFELAGQQPGEKGYISLEDFTSKVLPQTKSYSNRDDRNLFLYEQIERVFPRDKEKKSTDIKYLPKFLESVTNEDDKQAIFELFIVAPVFRTTFL